MNSKLYVSGLLAILAACGAAPQNGQGQGTSTGSATSSAPASSALVLPGGYVEGSLVSAFGLTVDGTSYSDSEAYYTAELGNLQTQANAAGYEGYSMEFEAQVGLSDLQYNTTAFIAAEGGVGYAAQSTVNQDGTFTIDIPDGDGGDTKYDIRTNKRITVTLTSQTTPATVVEWCYNFSGNATGAEIGKSVLINTFTTTLTKYACDSTSSGITLPTNPSASTVPAPASTSTSNSSGTTTTTATSNASGTTPALKTVDQPQ